MGNQDASNILIGYEDKKLVCFDLPKVAIIQEVI